MRRIQLLACLSGGAAALLLAGCASVPMGPTFAAMPAPGEPLDQFRHDDYNCRQYASQQLGVNPNQEAGNQVAAGAVIGTAIGAAAGALLGHGHSYPTQSGAATGLLMGTAVGANNAQATQYQLQGRYNMAYAQCMYSNGAQVPGYAAPQSYAPPPPPGSQPSYYNAPPPPPPGSPPPPPPSSGIYP